ncbi:MAG: leucine-rich repeat domain-containing protein [Candidatus Lokiarchaeota archaeon]|nr:leucine-rich repeat domain-containing protein [Candidatus Lokiarchaeota archaeon]
MESNKKLFVTVKGKKIEVDSWRDDPQSLLLHYISSFEQVDGLDQLTQLAKLKCWSKELKKISNLEGLKNLKTLEIHHAKLEKIEGLDALSHLEKLLLDDCNFSKIEGLEHLPILKTLDIYDTNLKRISGLDALVNLEELNLYNCNISKIEGLDNLKNLKMLSLRNNDITKVEYVRHLSQLTLLDLTQNRISEPGEIPFLTNLERLYLGKQKGDDYRLFKGPRGTTMVPASKITSLEPFFSLKKLERLSLSHHTLKTIKNIELLPNLKVLDIRETVVDDLSPLKNTFVQKVLIAFSFLDNSLKEHVHEFYRAHPRFAFDVFLEANERDLYE